MLLHGECVYLLSLDMWKNEKKRHQQLICRFLLLCAEWALLTFQCTQVHDLLAVKTRAVGPHPEPNPLILIILLG